MFFLQKKLWIAWSKFRFLRLPVEKRVRLEVTTDGRHLTFLLTALGEAGYGAHVVGAPFVFRELMYLRNSVPMPFVIGGNERDCGISISDRPSTLDSGLSTLFLLDYDYFTGLLGRVEPHPGGWAAARETAARQPEGRIETLGKVEKDCRQATPKEEQVGKTCESNERERTSQITRIQTDRKRGVAWAGQAGASEPDLRTSELADSPVSESLTRSARGPALAHCARGLGSDGGNQLADSEVFLESQSQAGLQMGNQKDRNTRVANDPSVSRENSSSVSISVIGGKKTSTAPQALRMPYFMHPSVYHKGLHKKVGSESERGKKRRFRIGFFGTHDREFYTRHYHFPGMNRFDILEAFFQKFGDRITPLRGFPRDWEPCEIAVSIDGRGGDRKGKSFLSQDHYFEALRECDFVLSPPGWGMPVSHSLIEAIFCGAIPITNCWAFMAEPLKGSDTCLEFEDAEDFVSVIKRALAMDSNDIEKMRQAVSQYYNQFLAPKTFGEKLFRSKSRRILVNAEENSVPLVFLGKF